MARRKKPTRSTDDYLASAKALSKIVPTLKKFRKRKSLSKSEKATIRRREKQLRNIPFILPVTKNEAKLLGRKKLFLPGVQAVQLRGVDPTSNIKIRKRSIEVLTPEGQRWIYWGLDKDQVRSRREMRTAGASAFDKQFPIELVSNLTARAFKRYKVQQVNLWAHAGIVGDNFQTVEQFVMWVNEKWQNGRYITSRYRIGSDAIYTEPSDPGEWVNGIAILVEDEGYTARREKIDATTAAEAKAKTKKLVSRKRRKV